MLVEVDDDQIGHICTRLTQHRLNIASLGDCETRVLQRLTERNPGTRPR
jgi:hypothetical protein